ncbi:hypothetical protein [Jiulongibacter sp. NS-SX5]|uniref:hypothetical protein n=1 Tax=Jiulongibacter sp. NS-SX5 TaxID=3463854 RepID=UPI004059ACBD
MRQKQLYIVLLLLIGLSQSLLGQLVRHPVEATIIQKAPYPIYLSDYANPSQDNFSIQLRVNDNTLPQRRVFLKLYIQGPGIAVKSVDLVRDESVIQLSAGQVFDLPSDLVANYFQPHNLQISASQYAENLPEGTYQFGLQVIDAITGNPLSEVQMAAPVWVTINEPPVWVVPSNNALIEPQNPLSVNFNWAPRHKNVSDVSYEFSLVELNVPLGYTGNIQNLFLAQPPIFTTTTSAVSLNYNYSMPPLLEGKIYAYRVQAKAKSGFREIGVFRNHGFSEIQWFRYTGDISPITFSQAIRPNLNDIQVSWDKDDGHQSYTLNYKYKDDLSWQSVLLDAAAYPGDSASYVFKDAYEGAYEFNVIAHSKLFYQSDFQTPPFYLIDSLSDPYNLKARWADSISAILQWDGSQAHKNFDIEFRNSHEDKWRTFRYPSFQDYEASEEYYSFLAVVPSLSQDSSYSFRIRAYDNQGQQSLSSENYIRKKKEEDEILKLKEKVITGNLKWTFLFQEQLAGAISGNAQKEWGRSLSRSEVFLHENILDSDVKHPLGEVSIKVFADSAHNFLLKSIRTNEFGGFRIPMPAEGLMGADLPPVVFLEMSHPILGKHQLEVETDFEDEFDLNEWIIPVSTYRLVPKLSSAIDEFFSPERHKISIYRPVQDIANFPFLAFENFNSGALSKSEINRQEYHKIAEVMPGQSVNGLFYHPAKIGQKLLIKIEGPSPYRDKLIPVHVDAKTGVFEVTVPLNQYRSSPYVFGEVRFTGSKRLSFSDLRVELNSSGVSLGSAKITNEGKFNMNFPYQHVLDQSPFELTLWNGSKKVKEQSFLPSQEELGTRVDFSLENQKTTGVVVRLMNEEDEPLKNVTTVVNGRSYKSDINGWLAFSAPSDQKATLRIIRKGYPDSFHSIDVITSVAAEEILTWPNWHSLIGKNLKTALDAYSRLYGNETVPEQSRELLARNLRSLFISSITNSSFDAYDGMMAVRILDKTTPHAFRLIVNVRDKDTGRGIRGMELVENGLDALGSTNDNGQIIIDSYINREHQTYTLIPTDRSVQRVGEEYPEHSFSYRYPDLNSSKRKDVINIELESGSRVSGIVYKMGTTTPIPNAKVNIEFPGVDTYVYTDSKGEYVYRFKNTVEENFLTLTATAPEFKKRTVYMAASSTYGLNYKRDIYLKPGPVTEGLKETEDGIEYEFDLKVFGFPVIKIKEINNGVYTAKEMVDVIKQNYPRTFAWGISGTFEDLDGQTYDFEDMGLILSYTKVGNKVYLRTSGYGKHVTSADYKKVGYSLVNSGELKYMKELPIDKAEPLYVYTLNSRTDPRFWNGVIYTEKFKLNRSLLTPELRYVYDNHETEYFSTWNISFQTLFAGIKLKYPSQSTSVGSYPLVYSYDTEPIKEILFHAANDHSDGNKALLDLKGYYSKPADSQKINEVSKKRNSVGRALDMNTFYWNNTVFQSLSISNKGPQINKVIVMPLMSISNIHIDLMNIPFVRLSDHKIAEVLIDYSMSPRKLSMGEDVVKAQIEEVYVEEDGVDIVYFTNNGGNVIKPTSPNMTEVNYNANGIFYSDYKNQKEIVQTAAVLNEVEMMKIPKPAMGPGYRIKITASESDGISTGSLWNVMDSAPKYASLTNHFSPLKIAGDPTLKMEGDATFEISPHDLTVEWKYNETSRKWDMKLKSWTDISPPFGGIIPPLAFEGNADFKEGTVADTSGTGNTSTIAIADVKGSMDTTSKLKITYGVNIPLVSNFEMEATATWNSDSLRFDRDEISKKVTITIPTVAEIGISSNLFFNSKNEVNGLALNIRGQSDLLGYGFSGTGGYVCVESGSSCDAIWGFALKLEGEQVVANTTKTTTTTTNNSGQTVLGKTKKQSMFTLYSANFGFIYDGKADAVFIQLGASMGLGKEARLDAGVKDFGGNDLDKPKKLKEEKKKLEEKNVELSRKKDDTDTKISTATTKVSNKETNKANKDAEFTSSKGAYQAKKNELKNADAKDVPKLTAQLAQAKLDLEKKRLAKNAAKNELKAAKKEKKDLEAKRDKIQQSITANESRITTIGDENTGELNGAITDSTTMAKNDQARQLRYKRVKPITSDTISAQQDKVQKLENDGVSVGRLSKFQEFSLGQLFGVMDQRDPFTPREHPLTISDAEVTITIGKKGSTFTGAGRIGLSGTPLVDAAFLLSFKGNEAGEENNWRVFFAMPNFYRPSVEFAPMLRDVSANLQFDFGNTFDKAANKEIPNFLIMGGLSSDIEITPIVYVKANARLLFAIQAETDSETLANTTQVGGNTLSATAQSFVKMMGSSFNDIAGQALAQRKAFYSAVSPDYLDANNKFTGIYIGVKCAVMFGINKAIDNKLIGGSARLGIGAEVGASFLGSFSTGSWDIRASFAPVLDIGLVMRSPLDMTIIDATFNDLMKVCIAGGYNSSKNDWYFKFLWNIIKLDQLIGFNPTGGEVKCNQYGFVFIRPCLLVYLKYDSEAAEQWKIEATGDLAEDPGQDVCPIEW